MNRFSKWLHSLEVRKGPFVDTSRTGTPTGILVENYKILCLMPPPEIILVFQQVNQFLGQV